jgi:hypothetical protein
MTRISTHVYDVGPTRGVVFNIPIRDRAATPNTIDFMTGFLVSATDDTVNWSMKVEPSLGSGDKAGYFRVIGHRHLIPEGATNHERYDGPLRKGALSVRAQLLGDWARKQAAALIRKHGFDAIGKGASTSAAATDETRSLPIGDGDAVQYIGWKTVSKVSAHDITAIHDAVVRALDRAADVWKWRGSGIKIQFNESSRAIGLAWSPGSGAKTGERRICLNVKLVSEYVIESVYRVLIHELCHHAREEVRPRDQSFGDVHDTLFRSMLIEADPKATRARAEFFDDVPDPALVARLAPKTSAVFDPTVGFLEATRLKSGQMRFIWKAASSGVTWRPVVFKVSDVEMVDLIKRFAPSDWRSVRVLTTESWPWKQHQALIDVVGTIVIGYPGLMGKTAELIESLSEAKRAS